MIDFHFKSFQTTKGFAATFVLDNSKQTHVYLCFENKKQSCLMLPSNLCCFVAQHNDLDRIEHLSNFGIVAESTTQLWIISAQLSGKVCKRDKTNHQRIFSRSKICNHETICIIKIFLLVIVEGFADMTSLISVKVQLSAKEKKSMFFLML